MITGATRLAGVIGDPVRHSRSPMIFNAAFAAAGLDWVYVAFPVAEGNGADAVRAMPLLDIAALNVTMPHKAAAASACDLLGPDAAALGVVNAVVREADGRLRGEATDGLGFVRATRELGFEFSGASVVVLGAGGAARAIARALGAEGARVSVAARRTDTAVAAAALAPGGVAVDWSDRNAAAAEAQLVVNATPIGMEGEVAPIDVAQLAQHAMVIDTIYHPETTPLVAQATARGLRAANGIGMLVHQAALAFEHFTGHDAPLDVMRWAALDRAEA